VRYALSLLILAACLGGCGTDDTAEPAPGATGQGFAEAMALLCDAERRSGAADRPPAERIQLLTEWINRTIENPEVRNLVSGLTSAEDPAQVRQRLEQAVERAGLEECALLSFFELT
jgi:hypothetical protein